MPVFSKFWKRFLYFRLLKMMHCTGLPTKDNNVNTKTKSIWQFEAWFLVSAFKWVFWGFNKWLSNEIRKFLPTRKPECKKNGINKFHTNVSEVSFFVGNPVWTNYQTSFVKLKKSLNEFYSLFRLSNKHENWATSLMV